MSDMMQTINVSELISAGIGFSIVGDDKEFDDEREELCGVRLDMSGYVCNMTEEIE